MAVKIHLQRLLLIIRKIQSHKYITFEKLTKELEHEMSIRGYEPNCSRNTLQRDIKEIREEFFIEIKYNRQDKGYYIDKQDITDPNIEQFIESFELLNSLNADKGIPDFVLPEKHQSKGTEHLFTLIDAIKRSLYIEFTYKKYTGEPDTNRILQPYVIKEFHERWYVIGRENSGIIKTFGLDRIKNLIVTPRKFQRDQSFNIVEKFQYSYGIYSSNEYPIEDIILAFDAEDGNYLKSAPLHSSQKIIKETHEELIIKLSVRLTPDFLMEIISRSWSLRIISPEYLRSKICSIYKKALERNNINE